MRILVRKETIPLMVSVNVIIEIKIACHSSCFNCTDSGINHCTSCYSNNFVWEGKCISGCPIGTYLDLETKTCKYCHHSCTSCNNITYCTSCSSNYYLVVSENTCVLPSGCPLKTYPDPTSRICNNCHMSCLTCIGPFINHCKSCDLSKGYMELTTYVGTCDPLVCSDGTYLNISSSKCEPCNSRCLTCIDNDNCLECKSMHLIFPIPKSNKVYCKDCPIGYKIELENTCKGNLILKYRNMWRWTQFR